MGKQEQSSADAQLDWKYFTYEAVERRPQDAQELLSAIAAHIESVREAERTRIARAVHDQLDDTMQSERRIAAELRPRVLDDADLPGAISPAAALHDPRALGLLGMRERALLLGGKVETGRSDGGGTGVRRSVPLQLPAGTRPLRE